VTRDLYVSTKEIRMPPPQHEAYQNHVRTWLVAHAHEPDVPAQLLRYREALLVLWTLDLEPARAVLEACYAPSPRGGKPKDPVMLLRCLLLMLLVGQPSINKWVADLEASRVLQLLAGLDPDTERRPGVGTFYDLLHRLHDGPMRRTCDHEERPSERERRRARSPQPARRGRKQKAKAAKPSGRKKRRKKGESAPDTAKEPASAKVAKELEAARELDNPDDLLARLSTLLVDVAVTESARRGLLGDLGHIVAGGDGSPLVTGASKFGKKTCEHSRYERCDCDRIWADPDARYGWDPHRERYFFGHHFYELSVSTQGHDLPLALRLDPGNGSDFTASLYTFEHLRKTLEHQDLPWSIDTVVLDAGHDGEAVYRYFIDRGSRPVIPLKCDAPAVHPCRPELALSKNGIPLCPAGVEMASWGSAGPDRKVFICPVKANRRDCCPLAPEGQPDWRCRPDQKWGPSVAVKVSDNPRLCPPVPRNSSSFQKLLNHRSGCERSNAMKKGRFKLEEARHRRASFWLIRLHLVAILQHALAWVADTDAGVLVEELLGRAPPKLLAA
jgi:hypothetical protein